MCYNKDVLDDTKKIRRLRTLNKIIEFIKEEDKDNSISRHFLETLILKHEVFYIKNGNRYLVDLDEVLEKFKRVYLDSDLTKIKQNQQAKLLYSDFLAECEEEFKLSYFPVNNSITLSQFIDIFLENIKKTKTLAHYSNYEFCSFLVKEKIGNIKLKDLTPCYKSLLFLSYNVKIYLNIDNLRGLL